MTFAQRVLHYKYRYRNATGAAVRDGKALLDVADQEIERLRRDVERLESHLNDLHHRLWL